MNFTIDRRLLLKGALALPAMMTVSSTLRAAETGGFTHDVASGDPGHEEVTLWTRYIGPDATGSRLRVEVASDVGFTRMVARGEATATAESDHCAHARATGLTPGHWYYYRFVAPDGGTSPIGRTRTLPRTGVERFRIGIMSCANATSGWFTAYAHAAQRQDLDLIVHLGDYIYESPLDRSDAVAGLAERRGIGPSHEAVALADYRLRYATYRDDPDLRLLHRLYPMIVMRDDHETANNSWRDGAANHDPGEGDWDVRAAAAIRAHEEWMPMRRKNYDAYQIGNLATLFRIETRNLARTKQLDIETALAGASDMKAAVAEFLTGPLQDPSRTMMGKAQEDWLTQGMRASVGSGTKWQLLAQQVIMAPTRLPRIDEGWFAAGTVLHPSEQARLKIAVALADAGLPMSLDRWDGYPAARRRLLNGAADANANLVVLSGDSHNAWAYDLEAGGRPVGVEFAGQGVSSFGLDKRFHGDPAVIARDFVTANPNLKWCDTSRRGYMILDVNTEAVTNEWVFLPTDNPVAPQPLETFRLSSQAGAHRLTT
ncbi:alkaline phosphatase D family protein [Pacificimonas sp. ICDLI1SI03]